MHSTLTDSSISSNLDTISKVASEAKLYLAMVANSSSWMPCRRALVINITIMNIANIHG